MWLDPAPGSAAGLLKQTVVRERIGTLDGCPRARSLVLSCGVGLGARMSDNGARGAVRRQERHHRRGRGCGRDTRLLAAAGAMQRTQRWSPRRGRQEVVDEKWLRRAVRPHGATLYGPLTTECVRGWPNQGRKFNAKNRAVRECPVSGPAPVEPDVGIQCHPPVPITHENGLGGRALTPPSRCPLRVSPRCPHQ